VVYPFDAGLFLGVGVRFQWENVEKRVIRYVAEGDDWNWKDYHKMARISSFAMHNLGHKVDVIFDLTQSVRLPGGAIAHLRSLGKTEGAPLTGRVIIIGLDASIEERLLAGGSTRVLEFRDQKICFADNEEQAQSILGTFQTAAQ
jgi:hypothetical protein